MANLVSALRRAIVAKLTGDATLKTFFPITGTVNISYRPTRKPVQIPLITMFDFGDRADAVPLWDRNHQIDVWHSDLDAAEEIKQRLMQLLDHQPLTLAGDEGLAARVEVVSDVDAPQDDGDLVRKTIRIRIMAYDYVTTYTN